jgi:MerR family transcriptional regulator, thiopeptide resistance regulator
LRGYDLISISKLAKMFDLSRSTLLYYDSLELLVPINRTGAGYRVYNEESIEILKKIVLYRNIGLTLIEIKELIQNEKDDVLIAFLMKKLGSLNEDIQKIKIQQNIIIEVLKNKNILRDFFRNDFNSLVKIGEKVGINEKTAKKWHEIFEKNSPEIHEELLKLIGFTKDEILIIRKNYN